MDSITEYWLSKKQVNLIKNCNFNTICKIFFLGRESSDSLDSLNSGLV